MDIEAPLVETELLFEPGAPLVTVMDLNGVLTYANREFLDVSGFCFEELAGARYDAIWHPDMPKICGSNLLLTMKCDKLYRSIVKNRSKKGSFFWTESIATPLREGERTVSYIVLHNVPARDQVDEVEILYRKIRAGEDQSKWRIPDFYSAAHERINRAPEQQG